MAEPTTPLGLCLRSASLPWKEPNMVTLVLAMNTFIGILSFNDTLPLHLHTCIHA